MKDLVPQMDNLKLRASWGSIGNDSQLNASQFVSGWQFEDRFILGGAGNSSASITNGMKEANLANPNITWYKVMTTNVGLDGSFWGGKLSLITFIARRQDIRRHVTLLYQLPLVSLCRKRI